MLEIDGAVGGGQLVRTALSLSAVTGEPFRIDDVRAERPNPGLRPQHAAAVRLLADVSDAAVAGAEVGAETIEFEPGRVHSESYEVDIGTAGSITLLFDAILPLATVLDEPLAVTARGGTDVKWSPPMDYFQSVKLPLLRRYGLAVSVDVDRRGFYPEGGGDATLRLWPSELEPVDVSPPDGPATAAIYSIASEDLAERNVAERQATAAQSALDALGVDVRERRSASVAASSIGSAIVVRLDRGPVTAGADAFGERGTRAETVGDRAVNRIRAVLDTGGAVDTHLADQLLVFIGLAGGRVTFPQASDHVETNSAILDRFGYPVTVTDGDRTVLATAGEKEPT